MTDAAEATWSEYVADFLLCWEPEAERRRELAAKIDKTGDGKEARRQFESKTKASERVLHFLLCAALAEVLDVKVDAEA